MNDPRIRLACCLLVLAAVFMTACGGEGSVAAPQRETSKQAAVTRSVLSDADEAARRYGQAHLGHFRGLEQRHLESEGLEVPTTVSLEIKATHTSFCVRAMNGALPSIHPWATATITSRDGTPSTSDRCRT